MDEKKGEAILPEEPQTETAAEESPKGFTRRQVVAGGIGVGLVGLIAGGALAKWGVIEDTIASGRMAVNVTPTKLIVTDRARCSGCQRCEMMCSLRNDGRVCQTTARVRVWPNYNFGEGSNGPDGIYRNCQFTVEHCKQCKDAACMKNCPVHAIYAEEVHRNQRNLIEHEHGEHVDRDEEAIYTDAQECEPEEVFLLHWLHLPGSKCTGEHDDRSQEKHHH